MFLGMNIVTKNSLICRRQTEKEFLWLYSKSQGAQLAKIINSITNKTKQNQLCEDL